MKILIVGGTGLIGGHAALQLQALGHEVVLGARKPAQAGSAIARLPLIAGDYLAAPDAGGYADDALAAFDAMVFAAGNDIRHIGLDTPPEAQARHWQRANVEGVPRFLARARDAGIRRVVHVGSFYPQVKPELVERVPYVRSRHLADEGARALTRGDFAVVSVNAPFVVGLVPGLAVPMFEFYTRYALGRMAPLPVYAPPGGTNFISTQSLSEAIAGALLRGEPGKGYLVGDENLSFSDYLALFFEAVGRPQAVPTIDREHPLLPDSMLYAGRGGTLYYEPDPDETALLGYRRHDVRAATLAAARQAQRMIEAQA